MKNIIVTIIVVGILWLGLFSPVLAQSSSDSKIMPDSFWYPVKIFYEDIITFFTFDNLARAKRYLDLANDRLTEIDAMRQKGDMEQVQKTLVRYQNTFKKAQDTILVARAQGEKVEDAVKEAIEIAKRNEQVLQGLYDVLPDGVKESAKKAMESTTQEKEDWLSSVKNEFQDQLFNQGKENVKNLPRLNNDIKEHVIPKFQNINQ